MAEILELIKSLPLPALMVLAAVLGLIIGVRYLGLWQGQNALPKASEGTAQVAAVIVDPSALNRLTAAGEALNVTLTEMNMIGREAARVHSEDVKVMGELRDEVDRIREEMRIQREISRR
jgi:hypothetical protein